MKLICRFFFSIFIGVIFLSGGAADAMAQSLRVAAPSDSLEAGDVFTYSITLKKDRAYDRIIFPDSAAFGDSFELRDYKRYSISSYKDSLSYQIQFWGIKTDTIAALPVRLIAGADTTMLYTNPVVIRFNSVLTKDDNELRPLKPIFDFAAAWWPWLAGVLLLLLLGGAIYWFYWRSKDIEETKPEVQFRPEPFLNPLKELENNLRQLKNAPLDTDANFNDFYIRLGDAIRLYFEQLYRIPALESTSREIVYELNRRVIDDKLIEQTRRVLYEADMVKFAKFKPAESEARDMYEQARRFLLLAKEIHGPRIQQMRRQHMAQVEEQRQTFEDRQKEANI